MRIFLIYFVFSFFCFSCQEDATKKEKPNILLIVSEDNSADLGCYGQSLVHTPHLDQLAAQGIRFNNAYTSYAVCSPSRASIFTGLYPHQNGQLGWATHGYALYDGIKVLPNYLAESEYRSACLGKIHVNPESLFNFDYIGINQSNFKKLGLSDYASQAKAFIDEAKDQPYFLMVNFPDAHLPFQDEVEGLPTVQVDSQAIDETLPFVGVNTKRLRAVTRQYYNCMNRLDESVGMLLDSIGDLSNTLVIYLSDHGAQFSRGKLTNYEGGLKIPFIVHWPDRYPMQSVESDALVSVIDILPTVLDVAGLPIPSELPGQSLLPLLANPDLLEDWRTTLGADGEGASPVMYYPRRSIRNQHYKLIENIDIGRKDFPAYVSYTRPTFASGANQDEIDQATDLVQAAYKRWKNPPTYELYDLINDPWEWHNLADQPAYAEILMTLKEEMYAWRQATNDPLLDADKLEKLTREMDSINTLYPDHSYRKLPNHTWKYLQYLKP